MSPQDMSRWALDVMLCLSPGFGVGVDFQWLESVIMKIIVAQRNEVTMKTREEDRREF